MHDEHRRAFSRIGLDAQAFRATDSAASRDGHSGAGCRRLKGPKVKSW